MNYVIYTLLLLILPLEFLFPANLKWSAETRLRVQNLHNDTTSTSSTASYFRGRINFDLTSNIYKAYFQLQDSRLLGNQNNYAGQTGLDNSYPTFHQFYGQVSGPFNGKNRIRFGRFEMPLGNQRIFGRSNWGNYGRSFDDRYLGAKDTSSGEPTTDNDSNTLLDGALFYDTTNNQMKVYDLGNSTWLKMHVTATEAAYISVLVEKYDGSTSSTSGDNRNITQVDTVADAIANVNKVAVKEAEVGRLGAAAYSEGVSAYIAVLGTSAMSDPSTGYIKKVAVIDSNVTTVAGIDANVTTVAGVSANVTTVATNIADVNNFADLYQINDFTTTPTEDGGGNAVAEGDLAYDSTANKLKFYDGSGWQDSTGVSLATVQTEANNASVAMSIALG